MAASFGPVALEIPIGTTQERPVAPLMGSFRYNTTLSSYEVYDSNISIWIVVNF